MIEGWLDRQTLLVVAVHPDDDVLGSAGLITRVKQGGGSVYVLYVTVGPSFQYDHTHHHTSLDERLREVEEVARFLKVDDYEVALTGEQYHLRLNAVPQQTLVDLIEKVSRVSLNRVRPSIVALPAPNHYHQDHQAVAAAGFAACRPVARDLKPFQDVVLFYEQPCYAWSVDRLQPNVYVDISDCIDTKIHALELYRTQVRDGYAIRTSDNLRRLAELRGREVGVAAAEAFIGHRLVI
jgi:LmbE family N-acetylglucosaminyl deacetylase